VTGASIGIGRATAEHLLRAGFFVVLTARDSSLSRFSQMDFLCDPSRYWIRPLDVTNAAQRRVLIEEITQKLGRLDVLVNNAGVTLRTPIEYAYEFEAEEQMRVNFHAPLELIKLCLPLMRRQGGGHIINVSSAAGFFAVPTMGLYAASKHALEGASEALFHELHPWNIHVTIIQPGFVTSEAFEKTRLGLALETKRRETAPTYDSQARVISSLVENALKLSTSTPEDVAKAIVRVAQMTKPPLRRQVTLDAQVFRFLRRFLPDSIFEWLISFCLTRIGRQTDQLAAAQRASLPHGPSV
jgi:NAD(P)-dependent dehydrogenase (short-subunit alcohol dehydrogenase family)